jgi:hypothetical protein
MMSDRVDHGSLYVYAQAVSQANEEGEARIAQLERENAELQVKLAAVAKVEEELREDAYTHLQSAREQSARVATRAADLLAAALKAERFQAPGVEDAIQAIGGALMECQCGGAGQAEHPCPFKEEINNDSEARCNCCENCTHECARDI